MSFENKYYDPLSFVINKKAESGDKLKGVEFKLSPADWDEENGKWVVLPESAVKTGETDNQGKLRFKDLNAGSYILEESKGLPGYRPAEYKWLLNLIPQEKQESVGGENVTTYYLKPTIKKINIDGTEINGELAVEKTVTKETIDDEVLYTFEHEVLNGKIPSGDIVVEKKWYKPDGVTQYTADELAEMTDKIQDITVTGTLKRRYQKETATSVSHDPVRVTFQATINYSWGWSETVQMWQNQTINVDVPYGADLSFSFGSKNTSMPTYSTSVPGLTAERLPDTANLLYKDRYSGSFTKNGANVYILRGITDNVTVTATFGNNNKDEGDVGYYIYDPVGGGNATTTSTSTETETVDTFTFNATKGWSKRWTEESLNENPDYSYEYYLDDVTETGAETAGFTFNSTPMLSISTTGDTTTLTYAVNNVKDTYTSDVQIQKTDGTSGLAGAVFELRAVENNKEFLVTDTSHPTYNGIGGVGDIAEGDSTYHSAFRTTTGITTLTDLPDGTYRLHEVHVPAGYVNTLHYIEFTLTNGVISNVTPNDNEKVTHHNGTFLITISNEPGAALPNTGGSGTRRLTILGSILIFGAGVLLWRRRRLI